MLENTFKTLLDMVSTDILFSDMDGAFYRQTDGVTMGSPVAPLLADIFLAQYDDELWSNSKIYFRNVDDVIRSLITGGKQILLDFVNTCHPNLTLTLEEPNLDRLLFFDLSMKKINSRIVSTWYRNSIDTGVILIFNAFVPKIYLPGNVPGFVHRIFIACSNWEKFNRSWAESEKILTNNQYPKQFISKILNSTFTKIISNGQSKDQYNISKKTNPKLKHWLSLEHRGKSS